MYAPVPPTQIMQSSSHRGGRGGRRGGRGGGRRGQPQSRPPAAPPGPVRPPPQMAWCELCRVECNTLEILEQHKSGKKHQKNVKVQQELERVMAAKASQVQAAEEGSSVPPPAVENTAVNGGEAQGSGQKRKMRGGGRGGGGKSSRRKLNEPPKPKGGHIPLICELCNVTCETQLVFQTHLKGKKHLSNRKRFEESEAVFGHAATQALYPALQPVLPAVPPDPQPNHLPGGGEQDLPLVFNHVPPTVTPPVAAEPAPALMNTTTAAAAATPTTTLITP